MQKLAGKIAVVTGAAAGIGLALAETFGREGARLALIDKSETVHDVARRIGADHRGFVADLGDDGAIEATFARILDAFSTVHILVNNAGIAIIARAESTSTADWDRTIRVNLRGPFLCARSVAPCMLRQKWGRIISVASQAALIDLDNHAAYSASKAGLLGMTNCLAVEWGPFGIAANCVSPTVVETELGRSVWTGRRRPVAPSRCGTPRASETSRSNGKTTTSAAAVPSMLRCVGRTVRL